MTTLRDVIALPILLLLTTVVVFIVRELYYRNQPIKRFVMPAYLYKVVGLLLFNAIYLFYYNAGDTIGYFHSARVLYDLFWYEPLTTFQLIRLEGGEVDFLLRPFTDQIGNNFLDVGTYTVVKICFVLSLFSGWQLGPLRCCLRCLGSVVCGPCFACLAAFIPMRSGAWRWQHCLFRRWLCGARAL